MSSVPEAGGFRRGVRLAIDWGAARIGVAACDAEGLLAYPVETVPARDVSAAYRRLRALVDEYEPAEIVMGLPLALDGTEAIAAGHVLQIARQLAAELATPLRVVDERLTTAAATRYLTSKNTRQQRRFVDQAAATGILEGALSYERNTGTPPGYLIEHMEGEA